MISRSQSYERDKNLGILSDFVIDLLKFNINYSLIPTYER